ncbi:mycothiol transferase [Micromonospora andamanensis]|uniref:mycothiol transferase n=1 Tax=Micromonospora andamanensis TaxID=1287068 RepID=UPI00195160C0
MTWSAPLDVDADWDFHSAGEDSPADLRALYVAACQRSRRAAAGHPSLSDRAAKPSFGGGPVSLRWIFVHMIEETAQHRGHLDLLRDALD